MKIDALFHRTQYPSGVARMRTIYLEKRDVEKHQARFYRIVIKQTLFGTWAMIREWGRIGSPGTVREIWFEQEAEAVEASAKLLQQKTKRGYRQMQNGS